MNGTEEQDMGHPGLGMMIGMFGGFNSDPEAFKASLGKRLSRITLNEEGDGALELRFEDGTGISLRDDARSCCESRYMTTDDDLESYVGQTLEAAEVSEGPTTQSDWGEPHDTAFLRVRTGEGTFTVCTHNEHNGYYGGIAIVCAALPEEATS